MTSCMRGALVSAVLILAADARAANFTLSDAALMTLDYQMFSQTDKARIVGRRDVPGDGVEFDICFPRNVQPYEGVYYVSSQGGGAGTLMSIDPNPYDNFALNFTLVSVDGVAGQGVGGVLTVGSLIGNRAGGYAYHPESISFNSNYPTTIVSEVPGTHGKPQLYYLGFRAYIVTTQGWDTSEFIVTLRVGPAAGAVVLPEPSACLFAMLGLLAASLKRSRHSTIMHINAK